MTVFAARYSDGRSASVQIVAVRLGPDGLSVYPAENDGGNRSGLATWPYDAIVLIDGRHKRGPVRLTVSDDEDARLTVEFETAAFLKALYAVMPRVKKSHPIGRGIAASFAALIVAAGLFYAALVWMPPLAARVIPESWEARMGEQTAEGLASLFGRLHDGAGYCTNAAGQAVINGLTRTLARAADSPFAYRVRVLNIDMINAFAASGGHIVVFRGLIDSAEHPDEVAAVLAHEIAHVEEHHVTEAMVRAMGTQIVINAMLGGGGDTLAGFGHNLINTGYSREAERAADKRGLEILRAAGLRTHGMTRFFQRLKEAHGDTAAALGIFSTHPPTEERIRSAKEQIEDGNPALSGGQWQALKAICTD